MQSVQASNIVLKRNVFSDAFFPLLNNDSRYLVLYGGGSSGKSYFIAQRYIWRLMNESPLNLMVVRQTGDTNRDTTFALLKQIINKWHASKFFKINDSDMRIVCLKNGNAVIFKGLDDVEKLKSTTFQNGELTDIWLEEASEISEASFNQLDVRLRGGKSKKQIVLSFNPVSINHWLKRKFYDKSAGSKCDTYVYSEDAIDGRNIKLLCTILHTTYKDNKFLGDAERLVLEAYKDTDPYYYTVYCLGQWGSVGATIFDSAKISVRISQLQDVKPVKRGMFVYGYLDTGYSEETGDDVSVVWKKIDKNTIQWTDVPDGYISIYEDVKRGYPYVIGGDTSGEGSDYFLGQVINNVTGKQAATLRHQYDEDTYAEQMYCLGMYFNKALIGIESNFTTYPIKKLDFLGYPFQFMREIEDSITHNLKKQFGFQTTKLTRPLIIAQLVEIVRENPTAFNDLTTLNEMLSFVRNEKGRPEAAKGSHDDCIMSLAIAYYIRTQQASIVKEEPVPKGERLIDKLKPKVEVVM
jgi:phage terminase large subunit